MKQGVLRGNESEQYQYYIDHFLKDKQYLNDLFSLYPVLERRINEIIQNAIDIYKEVIERIEKDADVLMKKFNISQIDVLKIDIEGSEKELFESDYEEWLPNTRMLIIELHDGFRKGASKSFFNAISKYNFHMMKNDENLIFYNMESF